MSQIFWTSLTFLDPLAAALLFLKPRAGLILTMVIIVIDVAHNTLLMQLGHGAQWLNWMYLLQIAFMLLVLFTFKFTWKADDRI